MNNEEKILSMLENMSARFDKMDERFNKTDERFNKMDERFDKMDERFDKMESKFETLQSEIGDTLSLAMNEVGQQCERAVEESEKRVRLIIEGELMGHMRAISDGYKNLDEKHNEIVHTINRQQVQIDNLKDRVNALEQKVS